MSDNQINFLDLALRAERPVVLPGGSSLVPVPPGSQVEVGRSRWGVEVTLAPWPEEGHPAWPRWPMLEDAAVEEACTLLRRVNRTGEALGYHGPNEEKLERRMEREISRFAPPGAPPVHVFACKSGTAACEILDMAILYKRFAVERRRLVVPPMSLAAAVTFEATWTRAFKAFERQGFVDVDENGCMDPEQTRDAVTPEVQFLNPTLLYDHAPDLDALGDVADEFDLDIAIDGAHGRLVRIRGIHIVYFNRVAGVTGSGQSSKPETPGDEFGWISTTDPVIAAFIEMLRNVGRKPNPLPSYWPDDICDVLGDNARVGEVPSLLMWGSLDLHERWAPHRASEIRALRAALDAHPELPWQMLPQQPDVEGLDYKIFLQYSPERSEKAGAWARLGYEHSMSWCAQEGLTEVATCYPTPDHPAAEYHPNVPWAPTLIPTIDPSTYPRSRELVARAHLLPYEFPARQQAAQQALGIMLKMNEWVSHPEIQRWAATPLA